MPTNQIVQSLATKWESQMPSLGMKILPSFYHGDINIWQINSSKHKLDFMQPCYKVK